MNPSELRHRLTFQENIAVTTSSGFKDNWTDIATVWAAVQPLNSREFFIAQQANSEITTKIKVRYSKLLDKPNLRAVFGYKIFHLESPMNPEYRNKELIFFARVKSNE